MSLIRHRRGTFLLYKETEMQKWARMLVETGKAYVDPSAMMTQMREDSDFCSLPSFVLANTFGHHKAYRRWTWHSPSGQHHNQIDYIHWPLSIALPIYSLVKFTVKLEEQHCRASLFSITLLHFCSICSVCLKGNSASLQAFVSAVYKCTTLHKSCRKVMPLSGTLWSQT